MKTVGAGGRDRENTVPLCPRHHDEVHTKGKTSFEEKYDVDLKQEAVKAYERI